MKTQEDKIKDGIVKLLSGHLACSRVWEAWQVGTMKEDDFSPLEEDEDVVNDFYEFIRDEIAQTVAQAKKDTAEEIIKELNVINKVSVEKSGVIDIPKYILRLQSKYLPKEPESEEK